MPQNDPIFASTPPDQTTSWMQITRVGQTRPDQTIFFGQTIRGNRLRQTRPDQLSFLPQITQSGQHSLPSPHRQDALISFLSQVRSILCVLDYGRLICKALDEPYKTYFPHTFGLKSLDFLFWFYLIVGRVASGVPWAIKGLPYRFFIVGLLCRYSVSDSSSAFQKQFRPRLAVCSSFRRFYFLVSPSYVIVFNAVSRLVAPNSANFSIILHLLVYALGKWSFHSIICFNSKFYIILLKTLLTKTFFWSL